jgi:asparagine synthase (glutamine-hydrolysing)
MCGISGYVDLDGSIEEDSVIRKMISTLHHRGPDNEEVYVEKKAALGHARLSILDLSCAGSQPMHSDDRTLSIIYNGEVYNFKDLRKELERCGYSFRSGSDTEVVLKGFQHYGPEIFKKLNGIFALAIWDSKTEKLTLSRDRFGVKPLYLSLHPKGLIFASEIKAILASELISPTLSYQAFHEFLYYGNAIGHKTLFSEVVKLQPGHYAELTAAGFVEKPYWQLEDISLQQRVNENQSIEKIRTLLDNAVKRQLVSDVPVGVFLSGGIDSSCITAYASKHYYGKINTFSCGFDFDLGINELPKAKKVAEHFGTDHHEMFIKGENLPDVIIDMVYHHDEPFSDAANVPLFLLSKALNHTHKVILQGDGGDEIFAGYNRYNVLGNLPLYRAASLPARLLSGILPENRKNQRYKRMMQALLQKDDAVMMALLLTMETTDESPLKVLSPDFVNRMNGTDPFRVYKQQNQRLKHLDLVQRMLWTDTQIILPETFLEKVDKSTMASSIEVRVPLLDNELTEYVMGLPSSLKVRKGEKKWALRKALRGVVPDEILDGKKTGFSVPYSNWLRQPLRELLISTLNDPEITRLGLFDSSSLNLLIDAHITGRKNNGFLLWKLMNLCIWLKKYKVRLSN